MPGELAPDVICLQETKTPDEFFPHEAVEALGYKHRLIRGMKGYNGVAILSRVALSQTRDQNWCGREDCRHIVAGLPGGIELHNLYVPAGGDEPDPEANDKFAHKLQFLDEVSNYFAGEKARKKTMILVGDLNVAPLENDVWSHKQLLDVVSHTPIEVEKLDPAPASGRLSSTRSGISSRPRNGFTPGGAIAPATGRNPIAEGGSTISGSRPRSRAASRKPRCTAMPATGSSPRTTCRS